MVSAPRYRVRLSTLGIEDAEAIAANANSVEVSSNVDPFGRFPNPYGRKDALGFIEHAADSFTGMTGFHFGIRAEAGLIGVCGIKGVDYVKKECEIGYWIGKDYWGRGYGREAVGLLLEVAFGVLGMSLAYGTVARRNERSSRLLEGMGFTAARSYTETENGRPVEQRRLEIRREDYAKLGIAASVDP